ncbi:hypothetical protein ZHAS_00010924 [Anopheles sinensis]|uniref:Uncharacterized protein n=1 Tax=Anopheles sinensis TaxID=74873 RepID=A0A084VYU0_ANOSI|nr:hypothetical protein ZHAS_00010924 [Anopheles sinensis]
MKDKPRKPNPSPAAAADEVREIEMCPERNRTQPTTRRKPQMPQARGTYYQNPQPTAARSFVVRLEIVGSPRVMRVYNRCAASLTLQIPPSKPHRDPPRRAAPHPIVPPPRSTGSSAGGLAFDDYLYFSDKHHSARTSGSIRGAICLRISGPGCRSPWANAVGRPFSIPLRHNDGRQ